MGNITSLSRNGLLDNGSYGLIDDLTLCYDGNQLMAVSDAGDDPTYNNAWHFMDGADAVTEYEYDANGNITKDSNRNILSIQYNSLNLPTVIEFTGGKTIKYTYSADGHKLRAVYTTTTPATSKTVDYCGNLIFENGQLKQMLVDGGYIPMDDWSGSYCFYVKDHLGNNRMVVHQSGSVDQVNNYYPYGGLMANSTGWNAQRYKYNGKEFDRMHGLDWYDYSARNYDAVIGQFTTMDPMCEKYYHLSPYAYCANNPINAIDPTGCDTLNIFFDNNKWFFEDPIIAEGEDEFIVTVDGTTTTYTFSEGEYGDRVDALNLESNEDYTLGVYHISGVSSLGTGYYVTPGGAPSTKNGSKARIPEGIYPIIEGCGAKWKKTGVGGSVKWRAIRFHYEVSKDHNPRWSTDGCFVLSYDYILKKNGSIIYNRNESKAASRNFDILVGGAYPYINKENGREATKFLNPITAKLLLKSRKKMEILISFLLVLFIISCTNTSPNGNSVWHDSTDVILQDTAMQVIKMEEPVIISENNMVIKEVLVGHTVVGKIIRLGNSISLVYDNALVSGDTLVFVTDDKNIQPLIDFHSIYSPKTENQIRNLMGHRYKVLKTIQDSDMADNTDGNYDIPYLYFINKQDSLQYMITFPYDNLKTPYTYQFCEAIIYKNSDNPIAKAVFHALSEWRILDFIKRYPRYKYVWLIPTSQEDDFREWSLFVWFDDSGIYRVLISIDACDELIYNRKMSSYMFGLE